MKRGHVMKVLVITAKLASTLVKRESAKSEHNVHVHVVDTPIAAFLTPKKIVRELENYDINGPDLIISNEINKDQKDKFDLKSFDLILTPGLIRKDVDYIKEKTGIDTCKGPRDAADLAIVLEMLDKLKLSSNKSADSLVEEELRKRALSFIDNFEMDEENKIRLLKKPENILVGKLPVGEDFPMRVLAEIANAPLLTDVELLSRAQYFVRSGADMIDIGMVAGESLEKRIPNMVKLLKKHLNVAISIDSLNPVEIISAVNSGVDMVLSLDHGNWEEVIPYLENKNIPAVILPTDYSKNYVPETIEDRVKSIERLRNKCRSIDVLADLILDPINSRSIVDSIIACHNFKEKNNEPLFFGVGNVTELLDSDSVGVNALLAGIAMELGASILFTPEESGKTIGSVKELAMSSDMMFLAKNRGSIPKDLGINMVLFKDKGKPEDIIEDVDVPVVNAEENYKFKHDPAGSFKIMVEDRQIKAVHYLKMVPQIAVKGNTAKAVYDEIIKMGLISRVEHATYLGSELEKAEIAVKVSKKYIQDFPLFKNIY
jgi:dihydropteroate synthase-like protein